MRALEQRRRKIQKREKYIRRKEEFNFQTSSTQREGERKDGENEKARK